ncbi:hypothetical protein QQP08_011586 [Theobroma cacao]|nr:hypothetical protein QQP08_011586 [Theobroma cacao]
MQIQTKKRREIPSSLSASLLHRCCIVCALYSLLCRLLNFQYLKQPANDTPRYCFYFFFHFCLWLFERTSTRGSTHLIRVS